MKILLTYVPITDPTSGYHCLSYLAAYAESFGYSNIDIIDLNIKALNYSMQKEEFEATMNFIEKTYLYLKNKPKLNAYEQITLLYIWKTDFITYKDLKKAQAVLKDKESFFDYMKYSEAVEIISNWLNILSILGFPGQFRNGFGLTPSSYFNIYNVEDIKSDSILNTICKPFIQYFNKEFIPMLKNIKYDVIAINVTYTSQLPFALFIGKLIRKHFPEIKIIYGGTEVSDLWKYLNTKSSFFDVFDVADACIIGEGESAFVKLLDSFKFNSISSKIDNVLLNPKYKIENELNIKYENIENLPIPKYNKLDYEDYLSPYPFIYYSPSRGCYWNKCTFCDYGLNVDSPTSPWRHYSINKIIDDLKLISKAYKFIYFSVDVLDPKLLIDISKLIIKENIDIRWGAEIRLEENWSIEKCHILKQSGCVAISVGFESGNQRILNLINKGTKVQKVKETIINFSKVGIAVQIMGFTGFPSEKIEEAIESINFLKENRQSWTFGGLGQFVLTRGSIVAKNPNNFSISNVKKYEGDDISWNMFYIDKNADSNCDENKEKIKKAKNSLRLNDFERPWLGGVDTAHTFFYFDKYGLATMDEINMKKYYDLYKDNFWTINGTIKKDILGYPVASLFDINKLDKLHNEGGSMGIHYNNSQVMEKLKKLNLTYNENSKTNKIFIRTDGEFFQFPEAMIKFLEHFLQKHTINDILKHYNNDATYKKIVMYSVEHHFLKLI